MPETETQVQATSAAASALAFSEDHLTASELKELETIRLERVRAEKELEEIKAKSAELRKEHDQIRQQQNTRAAVRDSGVTFHNIDDVMKLVGQIEYDDQGNPSVDGVPLSKALQEFALANETHVDGRSIRALKEKQADSTPRSKADFKTIQDKVEFIKANSQAAYEALPLRSPVDLRGRLPHSWAEYQGLTISERARVAGQAGDKFIAELYRKRAKA